MGKSTIASFGGVIALAVAILGGSANIAYWVYVRKGSDGHDESMVRLASLVRDLSAECDRQKDAPAQDLLGGAADASDGMGLPRVADGAACDRLAGATLQLETVTRERDRARERAWSVVRYLVAWPLIGLAGLFGLLRSGRN